MLVNELRDLEGMDIDLSLTGFTIDEINALQPVDFDPATVYRDWETSVSRNAGGGQKARSPQNWPRNGVVCIFDQRGTRTASVVS